MMAASAAEWRAMSSTEMVCEASDTPVITPVSCCGKKPFGMPA